MLKIGDKVKVFWENESVFDIGYICEIATDFFLPGCYRVISSETYQPSWYWVGESKMEVINNVHN